MANVDKIEVLSEDIAEKQVDVIVQSEIQEQKKRPTADPLFYKMLADENKFYQRY